MEAKSIIFSMLMKCVIPENIHTSPIEGTFLRPSPPLWKFQLSFIHFFKCFGLTEPPTPKEIPIPSVGGVWIFSGTAHCYIKHLRTTNIRTILIFCLLDSPQRSNCCQSGQFWQNGKKSGVYIWLFYILIVKKR